MNTIKKSPDGNTIMVALPSGFSVRVRNPKWNRTNAHLGVQTLEWECMGKGLSRAAAEELFGRLAA